MGTHPIFESDFDCLTENLMNKVAAAVGYVLYLMVGAAVFLYFEQPAEKAKCKVARAKLENGLTDFGNLYFYQLGLNSKLCKGIHVIQRMEGEDNHRWNGHPQSHEIIEAFQSWLRQNCSEAAYDDLLHNAIVGKNQSVIDEFHRFYMELFKMAEFKKFDQETFVISGLTFRQLVKA